MSELYRHSLKGEELKKAVDGIFELALDHKRPVTEIIAEQLADAFENGLRVGLNLRCNEMVEDVPGITQDHDVLQVIAHSPECLVEAQRVCFNVIPGILELPECIADFGHKSFAAGFDKGYAEGWYDSMDDEEEEDALL